MLIGDSHEGMETSMSRELVTVTRRVEVVWHVPAPLPRIRVVTSAETCWRVAR